ncbi:MAG: hypothetical protein JZU58_14885 [Curvibacter lanceolatus]|jgi:hypothetical protein|uniref:hypothetical protein n=1 Tax=Curvibacter lanceolatus TaxID=86182 RepID=UPI000372EAEE|nr:hypothetical protein [Curvibacter lanceolatus]MBV5293628.1 hypothetical protein [Curvibacter lanceolatus]
MTNTSLQCCAAAPNIRAPQRLNKPTKPLWRGLALGVTLSLGLALVGCGGGGSNNCGSAGNTRVLHCAP